MSENVNLLASVNEPQLVYYQECHYGHVKVIEVLYML